MNNLGLLNVHSHFSLLRGVPKIKEIVKKAKDFGYDSISLTDTNNLYGAIEFYKECLNNEIKPIIGVSILINEISDKSSRLILIAKDNQGYKNILALLTEIHFIGQSDTLKTTTIDKLVNKTKGVIAILPPLNSEVSYLYNNLEASTTFINKLKKIFNSNLFLGINNVNSQKQKDLNKFIEEVSKETKTKIIPLPLVYYLDEEDYEPREVLYRIQPSNKTRIEEDFADYKLNFISKESLIKNYKKEYIENLSELIKSIELNIKLGEWIFPKPFDDKFDKLTIFKDEIKKGIEKRGLVETEEIKKRIAYELNVIEGKGYINYFLTVIDIINHLKKEGILTTTRGSAAGSLIAYLTGITTVDPIETNLPFERFLNPSRPSAPDIDVDIADDRRSDVINYISNRFGKERVAQIGTFGTMMAKGAIRDTTRALGYSYIIGDRLAKLIPIGKQGKPVYISDCLKSEKELKELYEQNEDAKKIINTALKIEGNARHISTHAAGIVISPQNINEYTPLEFDLERKPISQYNMTSIEDVGLVKFDFLGLTNLSILANAIKLVRKERGIEIDIENIPFDDKEVFKVLSSGHTIGIFQLGGSGISNVIKNIKPESLYDIAATIALYRPGPIANIKEYIERKNGIKPITYLHPKMKSYLDKSYGVIVYQEDLLYTAINLANYNWEEVDVFRKAIGKKITKLLAEQEKIFKKRAMEYSKIDKKIIDKIWELFEPFTGYGFNKAHALSYATLSYQTAYMKTHYTAEYISAHLTAESANIEKIAEIISDAKKFNIEIARPDINKSFKTFSIEKENGKGRIRFGLKALKNVGEIVIEKIIEEREKNGKYVDLNNFLTRIAKTKSINKKSLESLIKAGTLDSFEDRKILLNNLEKILLFIKDYSSFDLNSSLFGDNLLASIGLKLDPSEKATKQEKLVWEKELIGIYVSGNPLEDIFESERFTIRTARSNKQIIGLITNVKNHKTKDGRPMKILFIEDIKGNNVEATLFDENIEKFRDLMVLHRPLKFYGSLKEKNDLIGFYLNEIQPAF